MSYNDRLQVNNENLEYILDLYNELPVAGEGEPEVTTVPTTVNLNFADNIASMTVVPNEGEAFSSVRIPKPSDLSSENILENKTIAGIPGSIPNKGAVTATITEKSTSYSIPKGYHNGSGTVGLSNDDQSALIPENIREGISCLGVTGTLKEGSDITILDEIEVDLDKLDLSKEPQTISVPDGYAAKSATILKPADLKPENIVKGAVIAGVKGEYEGSGGGGGEQPTAPKETLLYENANATGFAVDPTFGVPVLQVYPAPFELSYGKAYRVIWDGEEYLVATQPFTEKPFVDLGTIAVGDLTGFGGAGNGEPFVLGFVPPPQNEVIFASLPEQTPQKIAVYEITDNECKCETPIFAMEHMDGFTQAEGVTPAVYQRIVTVGQVFSETEIPRFLTVQWDGVSYACPVYSADGMIFVGNTRFLDSTGPDTGIPFGIVFVGQTEQMMVLATDPGTEHSVAIYSEIVECNGGGSESTGGSVYEPGCPEWIDDICFWDYDGTLILQLAVEDAKNLTALPTPPEHDGLTFQGWNFTLEEVQKTTVPLDVGATYIPTDGKTHVLFDLTSSSQLNLTVNFSQTVSNGVTIDWGDGTVETLEGTGVLAQAHTYSARGTYEVTFAVQDGCTMTLGGGTSATKLIAHDHMYNTNTTIHIGSNTLIGGYGLYSIANLSILTIPNGITSLPDYSISGIAKVNALVIPRGVVSIGRALTNVGTKGKSIVPVSIPPTVVELGQYAFSQQNTCARLTLTGEITSLPDYSFYQCYHLYRLYLPDSITTIGNYFLGHTYKIKQVIFPKSLTSIGTYRFYGHKGEIDLVVYPATMETHFGYGAQAYVKTLVFHGKHGSGDSSCGAKFAKEIILTSHTDYSSEFASGNPVYAYDYAPIYVQDELVENYKTALGTTYGRVVRPLSEYRGTIPE